MKTMAAGLFLDQARAFIGKIVGDRFARFRADRDDSGFAPFSGDANKPVVEVHILEPRPDEFRNAQPTRIEQLDHGPIAPAKRLVGWDGLDEALEGCFGKRIREGICRARRHDVVGRVRGDLAAPE